GSVRLEVPLNVTANNPLKVLSSDDLAIDAAVTNAVGATKTIDLVADDANPVSPILSPTANVTVGASGAINGGVRLFAVSPSQFSPGSYTPPAKAYTIWYGDAGAVVGANFKSAQPGADLQVTKGDAPDPVAVGATIRYSILVTNAGP